MSPAVVNVGGRMHPTHAASYCRKCLDSMMCLMELSISLMFASE